MDPKHTKSKTKHLVLNQIFEEGYIGGSLMLTFNSLGISRGGLSQVLSSAHSKSMAEKLVDRRHYM